MTAERFVERLKAHRSAAELKKIQRYFKSGEGQHGEGDEFMEMPLSEIEKLLESPIHEARVGAVSIMGLASARQKNFR
jgi:hypothetical protein